jgi:hypothetical protein
MELPMMIYAFFSMGATAEFDMRASVTLDLGYLV